MSIEMQYVCLNCGSEGVHRGTGKYCSIKCQLAFQRAEKIKVWKSGGKIYIRQIRNYFLQKYGNICSKCGLSEWLGNPIPLNLDHADGNSENDREENFRLLCLNCDGQQTTYGARNWGKGRKKRRVTGL